MKLIKYLFGCWLELLRNLFDMVRSVVGTMLEHVRGDFVTCLERGWNVLDFVFELGLKLVLSCAGTCL